MLSLAEYPAAVDVIARAGDRAAARGMMKPLEDLAAEAHGLECGRRAARKIEREGRHKTRPGDNQEAARGAFLFEIQGAHNGGAEAIRMNRAEWPFPHQMWRHILYQISAPVYNYRPDGSVFYGHWWGISHHDDGRPVMGTGTILESPTSYPDAWEAYRTSFARRLRDARPLAITRLWVRLQAMSWAHGIVKRDNVQDIWERRSITSQYHEMHLDPIFSDENDATGPLPARIRREVEKAATRGVFATWPDELALAGIEVAS